jgi:GAF domain-containing protein
MGTDAERLHILYEITRRLAVCTDLDDLLRYATRRAREVFDAEGCALLLVDGERRELSFPVASQREAHGTVAERLAEIRFPADRGIAGWVLEHDQAVAIRDAQTDGRFYDGIDRLTGMSTRSVLCAPLRAGSRTIGVISVVNPARETTGEEDLAFLEALAGDVAVAHERAALYAQLRGEAIGLRQACTVAGIGVMLLGLSVGLSAVYAQLALALPLREIAGRPGSLAGVAGILLGGVLLAVGRGWFVRQTPDAT